MSYRCADCDHHLTDHFNDTPRPNKSMEARLIDGEEKLVPLKNQHCRMCNRGHGNCQGYALRSDDGVVMQPVDVISTMYSLLRRHGH